MSWKNNISNCFNIVDKEFAAHATERKIAQQLLNEALSQNVGFAAYLAEFESWLTEQNRSPEQKQKQISRISNIQNYFQND